MFVSHSFIMDENYVCGSVVLLYETIACPETADGNWNIFKIFK